MMKQLSERMLELALGMSMMHRQSWHVATLMVILYGSISRDTFGIFPTDIAVRLGTVSRNMARTEMYVIF